MSDEQTTENESLAASAQQVMERCEVLGSITEDHQRKTTGPFYLERQRLTRRYGTPEMRKVNDLVSGFMCAAGMETRRDNIGNIIGHYAAASPDAPTLLLGSHLDTVVDAGRYDGPLGVMVAIEAVARLHAHGEHLPFSIEVYGFADEEGLRFQPYLGSKALAGMLTSPGNSALHTNPDASGVNFYDAVRAFGGDPAELYRDAWSGGPLLGYCEVHIEQGPQLEARELPVGVVTAIQGQTRISCHVTGTAGHAGTVPMDRREDALTAACELILKIEEHARATPGMVATVGQIRVQPGASNVIPGEAHFSIDIRHTDDEVRKAAWPAIGDSLSHPHASFGWEQAESSTVSCDPHLAGLFAQAIEQSGYPVFELASGAGHDAVPLSTIAPVAMLFVRCKGGISHHPDESVTTEDVAVSIDVLERFLRLLAAENGGAT